MSDDATAGGSAGTLLKALREGAGLSQRALARRAGTTPETIARWERGVGPRRPITVRKLAAALGVPPEELSGARVAAAAAPGDLPPGLGAALALRGVAPGPAGYDVPTLVAGIEALGWRYAIEERAPSQGGRHRYRALVFRASAPGGRVATGRAGGATEAEALTKALVRLLERTA
jgi:transcriptional regulator with XRE-family HTH domain